MSVNVYDEESKKLIPIAGNAPEVKNEVVISTEKPTDGALIWVNPEGEPGPSPSPSKNKIIELGNGVRIIVNGNVVTVNLYNAEYKSTPSYEWFNIGNIPEPYRPVFPLFFVSYNNTVTAHEKNVVWDCRINEYGNLAVFCFDDSPINIRGTVTYTI